MNTNLISTTELQPHLGEAGWLIFDCRFNLLDTEQGHKQYLESHIPGAVYAHLDQHLSSPITPNSGRHPLPDWQQFNQWLSSLGLQHDTRVVVYDDSAGGYATRLWWLLKSLGHSSVALLDGGWSSWLKAEFEVDNKEPARTASDYTAVFDQNLVASSAEVLANLKTQQFQLIDVRAGERFRGEAEPFDPIAGHVPGAINMPLTENLEPSGLFKSGQKLAELYADLNANYAVHQQVFMCGSGVTACHSALAMCLAGNEMPRIYAGSWSEWIRDSARPIEPELKSEPKP